MNGLSKGKILVVGGRGIVGRSVIEYFSELPFVNFVAVSLNKPQFK